MSQVYTTHSKPPAEPTGKAPSGKKGTNSDKLKAERVELMLAALPGWKLTFDKQGLTRSFQFSSVEKAFGHEISELTPLCCVEFPPGMKKRPVVTFMMP